MSDISVTVVAVSILVVVAVSSALLIAWALSQVHQLFCGDEEDES